MSVAVGLNAVIMVALDAFICDQVYGCDVPALQIFLQKK